MPSSPSGDRPLTTGSIAQMLGAEVVGRDDLPITGLSTIDQAGPQHLTFIRSPEFAARWASSKASAAIVSKGLAVEGHDPAARCLLAVRDADLALNAVLELLAPASTRPAPGVHATAFVDPTARVDPSASIGPHCAIGPGASVAAGAVLHHGVSIGEQASVGRDSILHPNVTIYDRCQVGAGCILHAGVRIGADGFGYRPDPSGRGLIKIPHIGNVVIGDAVEIGANSCVDRAKFGSTTIGSGTKIDNLVQIAHNCSIGRCCIICGGSAIAGSVTLGDGVVLGGDVGVADNLSIGPGARVAARSGVMESIPAGETWGGIPAVLARVNSRNWIELMRLSDSMRDIRKALNLQPIQRTRRVY
jgi:UDP-3-O-[3-hydroxymyristoyl] glucosamine N-acyltransferase